MNEDMEIKMQACRAGSFCEGYPSDLLLQKMILIICRPTPLVFRKSQQFLTRNIKLKTSDNACIRLNSESEMVKKVHVQSTTMQSQVKLHSLIDTGSQTRCMLQHANIQIEHSQTNKYVCAWRSSGEPSLLVKVEQGRLRTSCCSGASLGIRHLFVHLWSNSQL